MSRFVDFINSNDESVGKEVVSESAVFHVPFSDTPLKGLAETVIEGDKVVAQFTIRGTHGGEFFGIPASGKRIETMAMNLYRFADGKIVEERGLPDLFGMMIQIGAIKPPGPQ
ncbi:hypothetical protein BBP40_008739 [Aspergillus hancockii]|nr:hypothetical protein BBP40_008739 [Aspergillus hancockii]